jgi:ribosomal protein L37AE/L43A
MKELGSIHNLGSGVVERKEFKCSRCGSLDWIKTVITGVFMCNNCKQIIQED